MTGEAVPSPARPKGKIEVELKYRVRTPGAADGYLKADEIGGLRPASRARTSQLEDRYVDTADGALARSGFAARLRVSASSTVVSVKSTARRSGDRGAHHREELEGPADRTSGPRDWPSSDARSLILELCGDAPLVELVTIRQLRRRRELRDAATAIELSLDDVDVVARSQVVDRFTELELELLRGDEDRLVEVARVLDEDPALDSSKGSKLETALAAVRAHVRRHGPLPEVADDDDDGPGPNGGGHRANGHGGATGEAASSASPAAAKPGPRPSAPPPSGAGAAGRGRAEAAAVAPIVVGKTPGVVGDDHIAEAGRKVLRFHFARMLAEEPGTREGTNPEALHKMRVATRRMRAAWRVFGSGFRPERTRRYRRRLREVASRLGAVRDVDVLVEGVDAWRTSLPPNEQHALEPLLDSWRSYREDARQLLVRELDSTGYQRFLEAFRVFVQAEGAGVRTTGPVEPHHVRDTTPSAVWAAYEQVRAYEGVLRWADIETLHDLRIAGKWLRYSLEFVREPLGPDVPLLVARVVALQDHLGYLHDADVATSMVRSFLVERAGGLGSLERDVTARYLASREREVGRLRRSVGAPWRGVAGIGFRRRLGRATATL